MLQHHVSSSCLCLETGLPEPALSLKNLCLLTHTGRPCPQKTLLFALMTKRTITHRPVFQITEAGSSGKNTIKATASEHGLSGTMMNGLKEACVDSRSIIRCWLAGARQEGNRHSLAGIRAPFSLSGGGLSSCHCHSTLVSVSRKLSKATQRTGRLWEVIWGDRAEWQ